MSNFFCKFVRPEYYRWWALSIVLGVFAYAVGVQTNQQPNPDGVGIQQHNIYKVAAEALLSLGSTFAIVTSGSFAYSTLINNRFYELHKRFYSDEIIKARQVVDTSPLFQSDQYQHNFDNLEYIYPTRRMLRDIREGRKKEEDVIKFLKRIYPVQLDGDEKTFSGTKVIYRNKEYTDFYLFIEALNEDYYMILKFVNFLNSTCIAYDSRMVPYGKFIHAFGPILKSYWPYFTRAFVKHRRSAHEIENRDPNEQLYEFLVRVSKDMPNN